MDLAKLITLQEIDKRIMELESRKGDIPDQVENLRNRLIILQKNLGDSLTELEAAKKIHRTTEMDIKTFSDKLNKYKEQLYSVRTNKEYDAITSEIETLEKKIDEIEIQGVEALENEEKFSAEVAQFESQKAELNHLLIEKEFELQQRLNESAAEQRLLESQRDELVLTLDRRLLSNYDRIRRGRNGIAIAEIQNYVCNACFATIPAQTVVEARKMEHLIFCETCGRILIISNHVAEQPIAIN